MLKILLALVVGLGGSALGQAGFTLPAATRQVVLGLTDGWNDSRVVLTIHERGEGGWRQIGDAWPGRLGTNGSVWGLGIHPLPAGARVKTEGDGRTPVGVFRIGGAWGYEANVRRLARLPYRQITPRDLWVEDSSSPLYNRHVVLDHEPATAWEIQQQMRQNDHAHSLKLFIAHNAPPQPRPGAGSAIFFHIWRDNGNKPTAGCTTMAEAKLRALIARVDPDKQPLYVILPRAEYTRLRSLWQLP